MIFFVKFRIHVLKTYLCNMSFFFGGGEGGMGLGVNFRFRIP